MVVNESILKHHYRSAMDRQETKETTSRDNGHSFFAVKFMSVLACCFASLEL